MKILQKFMPLDEFIQKYPDAENQPGFVLRDVLGVWPDIIDATLEFDVISTHWAICERDGYETRVLMGSPEDLNLVGLVWGLKPSLAQSRLDTEIEES